jgi:hypothetical protein
MRQDWEDTQMAVVKELIRSEKDGTLSFGNYTLDTKSKLSDFAHGGDVYKVKTFYEITKLERNGSFVYESVPGTAVNNFHATDTSVSFDVQGKENAQITLELEEGASYDISIDGVDAGTMATNMGGKLSLSVEFDGEKPVSVLIKKS